MAALDFTIEMRSNAEHMSPSGKVPFIRAGAFVVAEMDPIVTFVNTKGISLTSTLDASQKADMRAYMSLVNNVLGNAELYLSWQEESTLAEVCSYYSKIMCTGVMLVMLMSVKVTTPRYSAPHPWPLGSILTWQKRQQVVTVANKCMHLKRKKFDELSGQVTKRLGALGWSGKTVEEVYTEVETCCRSCFHKFLYLRFFALLFKAKPCTATAHLDF